MARPHVILLLVAASLVVLTPPGLIEAQLVNGFYTSHGCPKAESIIKSAVTTAMQKNSANALGLLRIFSTTALLLYVFRKIAIQVRACCY